MGDCYLSMSRAMVSFLESSALMMLESSRVGVDVLLELSRKGVDLMLES